MACRNALLAAVALLASAASAQASIIATMNSITNSATHPGAFDFNYTATLAADEQIATGSYLVLYDWGPALSPVPTGGTGLIYSNFAFTQQLVGPTPVFTTPADNASVLNVVATYTGPTVSGYALGNGANGNLGTFILTSPLGTSTTGGWQASQAQHFNPDGTNSGTTDSNVTTTTVPAPVPEPVSLAVLGSALALAGAARLRKR